MLSRIPPHGFSILCCILLCLACGIVDAVGFMRHGIFAANMTGNTVLLGIALAQMQWIHAAERAMPLLTFFAGSMAARTLLIRFGHRSWIPLLIESILICFAAALIDQTYSALYIIAFAMGMQASAVTKFANVALSTVVITSTLARIAERVADRLADKLVVQAAERATSPSGLYAMTWFCYLIGAVVAAFEARQPGAAMLVSSGLVLVAALAAYRMAQKNSGKQQPV